MRTLTLEELEEKESDRGDSAGLLEAFRADYPGDRSRPDWCFAAESGGIVQGIVGFRASIRGGDFARTPDDVFLFGLQFLGGTSDGEIGAALLREGFASMREHGAVAVTCYLDPSAPHADVTARLFDRVGFPLVRENAGYAHDGPLSPAPPRRLRYRHLSETGMDAYLDAVRRVSEGTLDRGIRGQVERLGAEGAARDYLDGIRDEDQAASYQPRLWKLAYTPQGDLAGLVAPIQFWDGVGAIGYIGVVPEHRGRGYVDELLQEGTAALKAEGFKVIADIDVLNTPMRDALLRAGYEKRSEERTYDSPLADLTG